MVHRTRVLIDLEVFNKVMLFSKISVVNRKLNNAPVVMIGKFAVWISM